jgi:hypothetical protein
MKLQKDNMVLVRQEIIHDKTFVYLVITVMEHKAMYVLVYVDSFFDCIDYVFKGYGHLRSCSSMCVEK